MTPWDSFFREKIVQLLTNKKNVVDIGGGLRVVKEKGNRYDPEREWLRPYLQKVNYKVLDPTDTYNPDIVGDIHDLPFQDNTQEALICIAVLEHVLDPRRAAEEMYRVLSLGGYCFVYVPFLYYYHAEKNYYKDYWRFTQDGIEALFRQFSKIEIMPVRGPLGTILRLTPFGRGKVLARIFYWLDRFLGKLKSRQVSGHYIFLVK